MNRYTPLWSLVVGASPVYDPVFYALPANTPSPLACPRRPGPKDQGGVLVVPLVVMAQYPLCLA